MLSSELEYCLNQAFDQAHSARHGFLTVEHLLLAIIPAPKVRAVLEGCGADLERLWTDLKHHVETNTPRLAQSEERKVQSTLGFQRVLQRALFHVQSSGKEEVGVVNVLVAIFGEKESHAVFLLGRAHVSRLDVIDLYGDQNFSNSKVPQVTRRSQEYQNLLATAREQCCQTSSSLVSFKLFGRRRARVMNS